MPAYFSIDYDDAPDTYRAVVVKPSGTTAGDMPTMRFETGDAEMDWANAIFYASDHYDSMICASSVDDFTVDDPKYTWDENGILKKVKENHDT